MNRFAAETVGLSAEARDRLLLATEAKTEATPFRVIADPRLIACPNCQVAAGERCTVPTDTARRPVNWIHSARIDAVTNPERKLS